MYLKETLILFFIFLGLSPKSQTVGVVEYGENVEPGYIIFSPLSNDDTYIIDECGQVINHWETNGVPGMMGKLDVEGNLIFGRRSGTVNFSGGGIGGILESFTWEGDLIFRYDINKADFHKHHDFEMLPNGNILVLGWGLISPEEAEEKGRITSSPSGIYTERIREIKPIDQDSFEVIWEWDVFDHLIQDVSDTLVNYGEPIDFPEKIDINYTNGASQAVADWLHCNSLDYNPQLDQIILNCRNFAEFWIIDHSTTTEEAKTGEGGNSGMGGDILYRWGNPEAYGAGDASEQVFYGQHDSHWIKEGLPGEGNVLVFNNGPNRPGGNYTTIEEVELPYDGFNYTLNGTKYAPQASSIVYGEQNGPQTFFSQRISGSQRLSNGNTIICIGNSGRFLEVNQNQGIEWRYENPSGSFISEQGDPPQTSSNSVFQLIKYTPDFVGFDDKDLTPGEKIEINPTDNCDLVHTEELVSYELDAFHDMNNKTLHVKNNNINNLQLYIYDIQGVFVEKVSIDNYGNFDYYTHQLNNSLYLALFLSNDKIIKQLKFAVINE